MKPKNIADEQMIRENYARMTDEQLLSLANDMSQMTAEAQYILRDEFRKRSLDTSLLNEIMKREYVREDGTTDVEYVGLLPGEDQPKKPADFLQEEIKNKNISISILDNARNNPRLAEAVEVANSRATQYTWDFIFNAKEKGMSYGEIQDSLIARGLTTEQAASFIYNMGIKAEQKIKSAGNEMIIGVLAFITGIIITLWTYSAASKEGGTYTIAWGAIALGFIEFCNGWQKREKYKRILNAIETETEEENTRESQ